MYSIYAPRKTAINVADVGNAVVTLTTPQVQDFLASNVQAEARQRGYIVNRQQDAARADLMDITITLLDHAGDLEGDVVALARLRDVIATWARRSRVPGVSGDRVAVVGPLEMVINRNQNAVHAYQLMLRLGTAVFFNDRRVTVDFAQDKSEFMQDLKNLFDHLGNAGAIGMLNGVVVEHEEFGEIHSGKTDGYGVQASLGLPQGALPPAAPAPVVTPAPTLQSWQGTSGFSQPPAPSVALAKPAAPQISDADLEQLVNAVRLHAALLPITDRAALKDALATVMDKVKDVQAAL